MKTKQKYVKFENNSFIIFPLHIQHDTFSFLKPISAGFCFIAHKEALCFGESIFLGLKCDDENDSARLTIQLFGIND